MNINIRKTYRTFETGGSNPPAEIQAKINASAAKWGVEPDQLNVQKVGDEWVWSYANKTERFKPIGTKTFDRAAEKATVEKCGEQYAQLAKYVEDEELRNNDIQQGIIQKGRVNGVLSVWYPQFPDCPKEIREKIVEEKAYEDRARLTENTPPQKCYEYNGDIINMAVKIITTLPSGASDDTITTVTVNIPQGSFCGTDKITITGNNSPAEGMEQISVRTGNPQVSESRGVLISEHREEIINAAISIGIFNGQLKETGDPNATTIGTEGTDDKIPMNNIPQEGFKKGGLFKKYKKKKSKAKLGSKISASELKNEDKFKKEGFEYKKQGGKLSFKTNYRNLVK